MDGLRDPDRAAAPATAAGGTSTVSCAQASTPSARTPTVVVQSTINALQTATNG